VSDIDVPFLVVDDVPERRLQSRTVHPAEELPRSAV